MRMPSVVILLLNILFYFTEQYSHNGEGIRYGQGFSKYDGELYLQFSFTIGG